MKILIYGNGSHADRIIDEIFTVRELPCITLIGISMRGNVGKCHECFSTINDCIEVHSDISCVFISTPDYHHLEAFKECLSLGIRYVYIEKPATGVESYISQNESIVNEAVDYIQVGFNYRYSTLFKKLRKFVDDESTGDPLSFYYFTGKGLTYKESFSETWRANTSTQVIETLGSHQVNAVYSLFPEYSRSKDFIFSGKARKSRSSAYIDTATFDLVVKPIGLTAQLISSWGSPLSTFARMVLSNGIFSYDGEYMWEERNCLVFKDNRQVMPSISKVAYKSDGLQNSIHRFMNIVLEKSKVQYELNDSGATEAVLKNFTII